MLIQIHFKRVRTLLTNRTKKQTHPRFTTQKKTIENITITVEQNTAKTETKLSMTLMTKTLKVQKFLLTREKQCISQGTRTQKIRMTTSLKRTLMKKMKKREQSHVIILRRIRKREQESTQIMHSRTKISRTHMRLHTIKRMHTQSMIKLTITTITKQQTTHCQKKKQSRTKTRMITSLQTTATVHQLLSQIIINLRKQEHSSRCTMTLIKMQISRERLTRKLVKITLKKKKFYSVVIKKQLETMPKLVNQRYKISKKKYKQTLQTIKIKSRQKQEYLKSKVKMFQLVRLLQKKTRVTLNLTLT